MPPQWSSPAIAAVAELIRTTTGLTFPDTRVADVEATLRRAQTRHGLTDTRQLNDLLSRDHVAREAIVAEMTIGETYFQRDPAQFDLLRRHLLPELLAERDAARPVRVWSAGCASGEEPYTVAMLFDELSALDRAHIIGTDISRQRLEDAQRGVYSKWSLRGATDDFRKKYFRQRGRFFELVPAIREQVDFRYLNLAEDRFPSLSVGIWGMDVILCRNVLIYFDAETVERVARRLIASLSEDGWLILGASDPAIAEMIECDVVVTDAGLVYRRPGAAGATAGPYQGRAPRAADAATEGQTASQVAAEAWAAALLADVQADGQFGVPASHTDLPTDGSSACVDERGPVEPVGPAADATPDVNAAIGDAYGRRDFDAVSALARRAPAGQLTEPSWLAWLRALANQGCLQEASEVAVRATAAYGATAELLYLNAVLLLQGGRAADAADTLRRALYLDRGLVVAHLTLADAHQRQADPAAARRALRNAAALLERLPDESLVPAADGETAGRLAELVRVKLRLLDEAA